MRAPVQIVLDMMATEYHVCESFLLVFNDSLFGPELDHVLNTDIYIWVIIMYLFLLGAVLRTIFPTEIACGNLTAAQFFL